MATQWKDNTVTRTGRTLGHNAVVDITIGAESVYYVKNGVANLGKPAIIRVSPTNNPKHGSFIKIYDLREDSAFLAERLYTIRLAQALKDLADTTKVEAALESVITEWPGYFNMNAKVELAEESDGEHKWTIIILSDADETKPVDGFLTVTRFTTGTAIGAFTMRKERGDSWSSYPATVKGTGDTTHWAIATFTRESAPILLLHRTIGKGRYTSRDYIFKMSRSIMQRTGTVDTEEWIEGGQDVVIDTAYTDDNATEHPILDCFTELGLNADEASALIDAGIETVEALAKRKSTAPIAKELGVPQKTLASAITKAKAMVKK